MSFFPSQNTPKWMSAGASPQTPLGELTALFRLLAGFKWPLEGNEEEGSEGLERGEMEWKEGMLRV